MSTHEPPYAPHEDDDTTTIDIESSIGWEPPEAKKFKRIVEDYARNDKSIWAWNSMVESRPANDWRKDADGEMLVKKREPADLFGTLWREGELAVLAGGTGVGKSVLAVQIAEAIARGRRIEPFRSTLPDKNLKPKTKNPHRQVLYFDLEHTADQFWQRYTVIEGRRSRRYDFSSRNIRSGVKLEFEPPEAFRGNLTEYLFHSIEAEIRHKGVSLVIIDSLAHLAPNAARLSAAMRTLRLWCAQGGYSILAVANLRNTRRGRRDGTRRATSLADIPEPVVQFADSVFTLAPSTMREDVRYLKHLKSTSTPITLDDRSVAMYYLGRMENGKLRMDNAGESKPPALTSGLTPSSDSQLSTINSQLPPLSPFLGFQFVNFTAEQDHLRNYAAEAQAQLDAEAKRVKRLKGPRNTIEMLMSPEYGRYLKGM